MLQGKLNFLTIGRTTMVQGGGGVPSPEFFKCCSISKRFCFKWKAFDLFNMMRYIFWVVALLEAYDVTKKWSSPWVLPRIKNLVKTAINNNFLCLHHFIHKLYFYCWKKLKNMHFHSKMAWPPATYNVIYRNPSNWLSLNLPQNARDGWANS